MRYAKEIAEEKEGSQHYKHLASKDKPHAPSFKSMSKDETKHGRILKSMSRTKALHNAQKGFPVKNLETRRRQMGKLSTNEQLKRQA